MISSALSRIFALLFVLTIIAGVISTYTQVVQRPIRIGQSSSYTELGSAGLSYLALITERSEKDAPDTTIIMKGTKGASTYPTRIFSSRRHKSFPEKAAESKKTFNESIINARDNGEDVVLDTTVTLMGEQHFDLETNDSSTIDQLLSRIKSPVMSKAVSEYPWLEEYWTNNKFSTENNAQAYINILPATTQQQIGFVFFKGLKIFALAFFFLCLKRLFRNFYHQNYFTRANVNHLRWAGWLLLIPQFLALVMYQSFLSKLHPVKIQFHEGLKMKIASYSFQPEQDLSLIFLSIVFIILSYVFKDGLKLKEAEALTI